MKKIISLTLAIMLVLSLSVPALAANEQQATAGENNTQSGTATITVSATDANVSYTLMIPANQSITFGTESTYIGDVYLTKANLKKDTAVQVSISDAEFKLDDDQTVVLPFDVCGSGGTTTIGSVSLADTTTKQSLDVYVSDWSAAKVGAYTGTITFNAEIPAA